MARGRRGAQSSGPRQLDRDTFMRFIGDAAAAKQELDDAATAHAGVWKKTETYGIHKEAAKLFAKLDRMEDTKRADYLRAFDLYRGWAPWSAQPDMFEDQPATPGAAQREDDRDGIGEAEVVEPALTEYLDRVAEPTERETPVEVEAEGAEDEGELQPTEDLTGAGYVFADGKQAALEGRPADTNPHAEASAAHPIWARGHAQGTREREEAYTETEAEAEVVPLKGGRRRAHEAAASVH